MYDFYAHLDSVREDSFPTLLHELKKEGKETEQDRLEYLFYKTVRPFYDQLSEHPQNPQKQISIIFASVNIYRHPHKGFIFPYEEFALFGFKFYKHRSHTAWRYVLLPYPNEGEVYPEKLIVCVPTRDGERLVPFTFIRPKVMKIQYRKHDPFPDFYDGYTEAIFLACLTAIKVGYIDPIPLHERFSQGLVPFSTQKVVEAVVQATGIEVR